MEKGTDFPVETDDKSDFFFFGHGQVQFLRIFLVVWHILAAIGPVAYGSHGLNSLRGGHGGDHQFLPRRMAVNCHMNWRSPGNPPFSSFPNKKPMILMDHVCVIRV